MRDDSLNLKGTFVLVGDPLEEYKVCRNFIDLIYSNTDLIPKHQTFILHPEMRFFISTILSLQLALVVAVTANPLEKRCSTSGQGCEAPKDCCPGLACAAGYKRATNVPGGVCLNLKFLEYYLY
jgi:hypothetical protein